jgi:hypothetical protein
MNDNDILPVLCQNPFLDRETRGIGLRLISSSEYAMLNPSYRRGQSTFLVGILCALKSRGNVFCPARVVQNGPKTLLESIGQCDLRVFR